MKIGILTYHRAENYGALLQAYALRTYIQKLGHNVTFIDYWPSYHVIHYRIISASYYNSLNLKGKIVYLLRIMAWGIPKLLRKHRLKMFMKVKMQIMGTAKYSDDNDVTEKYDVVVYGSDQIWRKQEINNNEYNPWYFGSSNVIAEKKISYAASMGIIDVNERDKKKIRDWMRNFNSLSVREMDLKVFLESLGYEPRLVIDPTFLLNKEEWRHLYTKSTSPKYILYYNLLYSEESTKFVNELSKKTKLPIKEINMSMSFSHLLFKRYISCPSVECFLQMIDGATFVVSNSFHGVAFSLIFEKEFWAIGFGKRSSRVLTLLNNLGLAERYVKGDFQEYLLLSKIDYANVSTKLEKYVQDSQNWLKSSLV